MYIWKRCANLKDSNTEKKFILLKDKQVHFVAIVDITCFLV